MKDYIIQGETLTDIASAVKEKTNDSNPMMVKEMAGKIRSIGTGIELPTLNNEGTAADMLAGKQLISGEGAVVTGTILTKTQNDLSVSGPTVTVPAGYYDSETSASVALGEAKMPATSITKAPTITVDADGLITASASGTKSVVPRIKEGYVTEGIAGTITLKSSATQQLPVQAAKTVTPSTSAQTAVAKNVYTTGAITVSAIPSNYEDVGAETTIYTSNLELLGEAVTELEAAVNTLPEGGGSSSGGSVETCTINPTVVHYYMTLSSEPDLINCFEVYSRSNPHTILKGSCILVAETTGGFPTYITPSSAVEKIEQAYMFENSYYWYKVNDSISISVDD